MHADLYSKLKRVFPECLLADSFSFRRAQGEVFVKINPAEVRVFFVLCAVLDALLHKVADGTDGDLALFVVEGFSDDEGLHKVLNLGQDIDGTYFAETAKPTERRYSVAHRIRGSRCPGRKAF